MVPAVCIKLPVTFKLGELACAKSNVPPAIFTLPNTFKIPVELATSK